MPWIVSGKKTTALWAPNGGLRSVECAPRFLLFSDPTISFVTKVGKSK